MIANFRPGRNWLTRFTRYFGTAAAGPGSYLQTNRPTLGQMADPNFQLPQFVQQCPLAQRYLALLGQLNWDSFRHRDPERIYPGSQPTPRAPFVAAYLIKLDQQLRYMADLHQFLCDHPALIWLCGFPLRYSPSHPCGFDPVASLPTPRQFLYVLRTLPNDCLQRLLDQTVSLIRDELPPDVEFGQQVCGDTKHILAWVKENNPKAYLKRSDRFNKSRQPKADPDCKLGCKRRSNQITTPATEGVPARTIRVGEYFWGYASGIIATKVPGWGEFVLAELTQTFDKGDTTFFFPLMAATESRLGFKPRFGAFDAAFDCWYVHDYFYEAGGFAAVPYAKRTRTKRQFDPDGLPLCPAGLAMSLHASFMNNRGIIPQRMGRYVCPLRFPQPGDQPCPIQHKKSAKGGCVVKMGVSPGARIRYQLDRDGETYKLIYNQRTATERINALAVELGIERPKLRNQHAIANLNTLIYTLLNLRAWQRICRQKRTPTG